MEEDVGAHFLLDGGILFRSARRLGKEVCFAMFLFLCRVLRMGNELVVGEEELVELFDVLSKRVPSRLLGVGQIAPKGSSKVGYALLVSAGCARHLETLSAPRDGGSVR